MLRQVERQRMLFCVQNRPGGLDRGPNYRGELDWVLLQFKRTSSNARNIEEIIQQATHVRDLSLDDLLSTLLLLGCPAGLSVRSQRIADRGERVAQFVGEKRQEFVFAAICIAQGFFALLQYLL